MPARAALPALLTWMGSIALSVSVASGCMFELEELVEASGGSADAAPDGDSNVALDAEWPLEDGGVVLEDAPNDKTDAPADACIKPPQAAACTSSGVVCGSLTAADSCGQAFLIASCGTCLTTETCVAGKCVPHTFAWKTSAWTACSVSCGGGTQTRSVWCERDDGQTVADPLCTAAKPATSQACNTAACCTPSCVAHDACGSDGCGGNCGSCTGDRSCRDGYCVWSHGNNGSATCSTICAWGTSVCVDTSSASCGVKAVTTCYCW